MKPIIIIPARMASTRLPNKPMALIGGVPMIVRVMERAKAANIGRVVVACDCAEIEQAVKHAGGEAVLTDADLPSGSDRIYQALTKIDPAGEHDIIINVQGDMPTLEPKIIGEVFKVLENKDADIATLAAVIKDEAEKSNPAVVKLVMGHGSRALYFSRSLIPSGEGEHFHHIGIYAYRRAALEKFVALPPSPLEQREKLEQLRALEAGMKLFVAVVDIVPLGVDTPEGLEKVRRFYE